MKKIISVFLLLAICLSMVSCTSQAEKVRTQLAGNTYWYTNEINASGTTTNVKITYEFEENKAYVHITRVGTGIMQFLNEDCWYFGGWDVGDGTITIFVAGEKNWNDYDYGPSDKEDMTIYYTYKNGVLRLYHDAEHTLEIY